MPRKYHTPAERALHLVGALAGKTAQEINDQVNLSNALRIHTKDRDVDLTSDSLRLLANQSRLALTVAPEGPDLGFWQEVWGLCVHERTSK